MGSKLDAAGRCQALCVARLRRRPGLFLRRDRADYRAGIDRAFRVGLTRGELNTRGYRPCSEAYPCMLHQMGPHPLLKGILSCGRAAPAGLQLGGVR